MMINCSICTEDISEEKIYKCKNEECNLEACIICYQKYLMESAFSPSCMGCKNEISLDDFVTLFPKKWRLNDYKQHTKNILWSKEQSLMNGSQSIIEDKHKVEEQKKIIIDLKENIQIEKQKHKDLINKLKNDLENNKEILYAMNGEDYMHTKNEYKYKCPNAVKCNGSLNSKYECILCDSNFCRDCFDILDKNTEIEHICDEDKKKTIAEIKKNSKACPNCGTSISKVDGCDQIFCVSCGTAFSWNTGKVENGIIHNPHAAKYFAANPEARERYLDRIHNRNNEDDYDDNNYISQLLLQEHLYKNNVPEQIWTQYILINRCVYNYGHEPEIQEPDNNDYRMKWLKKEIDDESFKKIVFTRYKKYQKNKMDYEVIKTAMENIKNILYEVLQCNDIDSLIDLESDILQVLAYMNVKLLYIGEYFELKAKHIVL